jgi:hypothetical protein
MPGLFVGAPCKLDLVYDFTRGARDRPEPIIG